MKRMVLFCITLALWPLPSSAEETCSAALEQSALKHDVPAGLLSAIAEVRQERIPAMPFVVNVSGWQKVFNTLPSAKRGALRLHTVGNMRLGCTLMSWSGNQKHFESFERMFEVQASSDYFARYMFAQFEETGSWSKAVAASHISPLWHTGRSGSVVCAVAHRMAVHQIKKAPDCE